jgi:hypothetical protein
MDHAEARARLLDLALEPARLRGPDPELGPQSSDLRAHLATCADCRAELDAWRAAVAALDTTVSSGPADGTVTRSSLRELADSAGNLALPPGLRARTLAAAQEHASPPIRRVPVSGRAVGPRAWLAIAAALVVVLGGVAFVVADRTRQLDQARSDTAALETVTAGLDRILQDPSHQVALLTTPAGKPGGSVSWSSSLGTVVVVADALQSPPPGHVYRCWIEQSGMRTAVGEMHFSGSLAYWAGSLDSWGVPFAPGGRFGMSLESIGGGFGSSPVLVGAL